MKITVCLSERVTADLVESAKAFNLTLEMILQGPARVCELFQTMAEVGGKVVVRQDRAGGQSWICPVNVPSLEDFRRKPGLKVYESSLGDLGGVDAKGTIMEVTYPDEPLKEIARLFATDSLLEAYSYGLWIYLALLRTARDYKGAVFGVYSDRVVRFDPSETLLSQN